MILLIDNYDSFVQNLARYFRRLGQATHVVRNDAITVDEIRRERPEAIVISPGPCSPVEAGVSLEVVRTLHATIPMLGVCLGHQAIAAAFGGHVVRGREPVHGRASLVRHGGRGIFAGIPSPFTVGRYHSLIVSDQPWPAELIPTAWTEDGVIMALQHRAYPVYGVQFHPESVLTEHGFELLAGFLHRAGLTVATPPPTMLDECPVPPERDPVAPARPVTF